MSTSVCQIVVRGSGQVLASKVLVASSVLQRVIGLLGHSNLEPGEGLIIPRCGAIHTWFMRFPIDAVFVDRAWRVVAFRPHVRPWRMAMGGRQSWGVVELTAGTVTQCGLQVQDQLSVEGVVDGCRH